MLRVAGTLLLTLDTEPAGASLQIRGARVLSSRFRIVLARLCVFGGLALRFLKLSSTPSTELYQNFNPRSHKP